MSRFATWFRWRALLPFGVFLILVGILWLLLLDRAVERGVEAAGAMIVGARVDLASADVRLADGAVTLTGLAVTNPDAPMTNLFEAEEIVADVALTPLLSQRVVIESLAVRGMQFGTPRATSGALERPSATSRALRREIDEWAGAVRIPPLSLAGLATVVDVSRVSPDSLRSLQTARDLAAQAVDVQAAFDAQIGRLDPRPRIDSARALIDELRGANLLSLGLTGATQLIGRMRTTLDVLTVLDRNLASLDSAFRGQVTNLDDGLSALSEARADDVAWALGQLELPLLDAPSISTSIFGSLAVEWVRPVLYWLSVADRFMPPGLDPRRLAGSKRARREGTTVHYPGGTTYPRFVLEYADIDLVLGGGGSGVAAGAYAAQLSGLTSDPAIYGRPLELVAGRTGGAAGPRDVQVSVVVDRVTSAARDAVDASASGVTLPTLTLDALGAKLTLGQGTVELGLAREDGELRAGWLVRAPAVTWERLSPVPGETPARGSEAWLSDLVWRAVSGIRDVEIEMEIAGDAANPSLTVSSNVGRAVARSLRAELGREVERAQAEVRAAVDRLVGAEVGRAEARVTSVRDAVVERLGIPREQLAAVQRELRIRIGRLGG